MVKKIAGAGQIISWFMIYGIIGGTERGQPIGNMRYVWLFYGLIMLCQFIKEHAKVMHKQKACSECVRFGTRHAYISKHQTVR